MTTCQEYWSSMKIIWIESAQSTNAEILRYWDHKDECVVLAARCQTHGRGQKGNSWEAEPYKNLSFSVVWSPDGFAANRQFAISEAVALSVVDLLSRYDIEAKVKWPNDIYVGDEKICGILIEHSLMGRGIVRTIAGVGINVNQMNFVSDAPNPTSMTVLTGKEYDLENLLAEFLQILKGNISQLATDEGISMIHKRFCGEMWRFDGKAYPFKEKETEEEFEGVITNVKENGLLQISSKDRTESREYAFKEVEFLLRW